MKRAQIGSLVAALLMVAFGCLAKFSNLFPAVAMPWIAAGSALTGIVSTRLFPPFLPQWIPPHIAKVASQSVGAVLSALIVIPPILSANPAMAHVVPWIGFASTLIGALGGALLPHEQNPAVLA